MPHLPAPKNCLLHATKQTTAFKQGVKQAMSSLLRTCTRSSKPMPPCRQPTHESTAVFASGIVLVAWESVGKVLELTS